MLAWVLQTASRSVMHRAVLSRHCLKGTVCDLEDAGGCSHGVQPSLTSTLQFEHV